ncbi:hypothetical protein N656DRAFT_780877 [Canariomyces notabilis]|uniref:Uncharacterized protein n=1 Tax=Canariomyces notabilis TaxID=2074819 RepID=A0AAN6TAD6_9PEZI|nr:hypothetical protein N656DRAFT_780877 [Canariomyces arenarius]
MASQDQATLSNVATFLDAGRELFASPKNQDVVAFVHDIIQKNQVLETSLMTLSLKLAEETSKFSHERGELDMKLQGAQEDLKKTKEKMNNQVSKLFQELNTTRDKLQRLQAYSVELTSVSKVTGDIKSRLKNMYSLARSIAEEYFNVELPKHLADDGLVQGKLADLKAVTQIPLPLSNSGEAKQMRQAAFLAVLAREMGQNIFQPTYLFSDNKELIEILEDLAEDPSRPEREAHLRSVLLAATEWVPHTSAIEARHMQAVVQTVLNYVLGLVPKEKQSTFKSKLENLCKKACEDWKVFQRLEGRVELDFKPDEDEEDCWLPLFDPSSPLEKEPRQKRRQNGVASGSGSETKPTVLDKETEIAAASRARDLVDAVAVWPAFYTYKGNDRTPLVLAQGYLLTPSQIAKAKMESKAQSISGHHRSQRTRQRAMSMSTSPSAGTTHEGTHEGERQQNGSF